MRLQLSPEEAERLRQAGADLIEKWENWYILRFDCPLLNKGKCRAHGTKEQPDCCKHGMKAKDQDCFACRAKHPNRVKVRFTREE